MSCHELNRVVRATAILKAVEDLIGGARSPRWRPEGVATLELQAVRKSFGSLEIVHGIDLAIADREFVVLVGPSGCGKSTILRMIAGLEEITAGAIAIDGRTINELDPKDRDIAMVFQDYALYPHMNVF